MTSVLTADRVAVGDELPTRSVPVTRATLVQYAGASLDRNPIHWDERFATSVGLPDVIAHGMFTMGAAGSAVAEWVGDSGRVVEFGTRFTNAVVVPHDGGTTLEIGGVVKAVDPETKRATVELSVTSAGQKVLGRCLAVVQLD